MLRPCQYIHLFVVSCSLLIALSGDVQAYDLPQNSFATRENGNADPLRFGIVNAQVIMDDPRLSTKTVQIVEPSIYLSAAMRAWAKQTGIDLECRDDETDTSGRWRVTIALRNVVTVSEAMDALRSALSEQGATWQWRRSGTAPAYRYRLVCPSNWKQHQDQQREQVQRDFEGMLAVAKRGLTLSPGDLKKEAASDPTNMLKYMRDDSSFGQGIAAFLSSVSPEQQQAIMSGDTSELTLPFDSLSDAGKSFALNQAQDDLRRNAANGATEANSKPTKLVFKREQFPGKSTPSLMILVGSERHTGGTTYIGGRDMENRRRDLLARNALLNDDFKKSDKYATAMQNKVTESATNVPEDAMLAAWLRQHGQQKELLQLAQAKSPSVNFIACLSQSFGSPAGSAYGQTLADVLTGFNKASVASKWCHDILLFHYTAGFAFNDTVDNVASEPLFDYVVAHQEAWAKQGTVPIPDIMQIAQLGNATQWTELSYEFDAPLTSLKELGTKQPLFLAMAREKPEVQKELLSEEGARLDMLSKELIVILNIPEGTPPSARVVCSDQFNTRIVGYDSQGQSLKRIMWIMILEGEVAAPERKASATQGGYLDSIPYSTPKPWGINSY